MELTQTHLLPVPLQTAWDALNDPAVLQRCIPGCESITAAGDNAYDVAMTAAVGPVKARFKGRMELTDIVPPTSYRLNFDGQGGAAGFGKGTAQVQLAPEGPTVTRLSYTAHAQVGGKLAQIGSRLVEECLRFARRSGYREIMLWTNDVLEDARRIYQRAGFQLVEEEKHHSFGHDLVGQNWWREL